MAAHSRLHDPVDRTSAPVGVRAESSALMHTFHDMLTAEKETEPPAELGDLGLLKGVRKFPLRVKCATLAWHALEQALETKPGEPAKTIEA